jgi:O-antigen biosynthesis protein
MAVDLDIIIPTKSKTDYLFNCLDSIQQNTKTTSYHIHVCDTGSDEKELKDIVEYLQKTFSKTQNISLHTYDFYNFAKINNHAIDEFTTSDTLLLCNNDIRLIDNCIDRMYQEIQETKNVGTVGCRLLFKNDSIQHAGQVAFTHKPQGWYHLDYDKLEVTHRGLRTTTKYTDREEVMGNTAALMMIKREVFYDIGGLVEDYTECFEDVQLNMESLLKGYKNIYLDCVRAYHNESTTRTKSQRAMMRLESDYFHNLLPFWKGLSEEKQEFIKSFHKNEARCIV